MADGTIKTLEQVKADAVEVSAQDIIDYNNTLTRVDELVKAGTLVKCQQQFGGAVLYRSKGKQEDGNRQYFIVKDNKLMRLGCKQVTANGIVVGNDGSKTPFKDYIANGSFSTISDSNIATED